MGRDSKKPKEIKSEDEKKAKKSVSPSKYRTIKRMFKQNYTVAAIMKETDLPRRTVYNYKNANTKTKCVAKKLADQQLHRAIKEAVRKLGQKFASTRKQIPRCISAREVLCYLHDHCVGLKLKKNQLPGKSKMLLLMQRFFPSDGSRNTKLKRHFQYLENSEIDDETYAQVEWFASQG